MNYLISVFTGVLLSLMLSLNGTIGEIAGNYASTVIIHVIGLIGIIIVLIATKSKFKNIKDIPLYMYLGGLMGVLTVIFSNASFSKLGVSLTVSICLLGQLVTSIIIDHFGYFNLPVNKFNKKKTIGLGIIILGICIMTIK
ncbi:DMT family transporter [Romboutsia sedimentorum]|uniref:DMT family transporter n=1 Tax=Romboutsia sedimentorum TaxID=1368474 RepID=A0ABT7E548_9FIRM|nr:DMT family transporter [Romboutsia sedimentorum]MDK2562050.1 DMT family transporter [Romboutsia sedimentorum]MDK2584289.1 DMT family transporter [Romboutsia sedimentorum]